MSQRVLIAGVGVTPFTPLTTRSPLPELVGQAVRMALDLPRHRRPIVEVQITRLGADVLAAFESEEETVP